MADSDAVAVSAVEEPVKGVEALQDDAAAAVESSDEPSEIAPAAPDHKRKLGDLEPHEDEEAPLKRKEVATDALAPAADESGPEAKEITCGLEEPPRPEGQIDGSGPGLEEVKSNDIHDTESKRPEDIDAEELPPDEGTNGLAADGEAPPMNGQLSSGHDILQASAENLQKSTPEGSQQGNLPSAGQQPSVELATSRGIEVPNSKVGVLIGKAGDTIRYLQINSGAKIQITRDAEANPHASTRHVELIGTMENINKAEQLIKDVIAEADAGGSPSLVARGFSTVQSGGEQTEIRVPNEKVGLIIGKGGETIKNLQTRSGARIQLIPQHLPEGDSSKERTVRITGNKKQIESAREMIKEVMSQAPTRPSSLSGGYGQQGFRPRGPTTTAQWGGLTTAVPMRPNMGHDYQQQQRGTYPPTQTTQYPQPYGGGGVYSQQPPPRGGYNGGWGDQRQVAPVQNTQPSGGGGGYDYYGQGGPPATENQPSNPMPNPSSLASTPAPVNYNYGQSQAPAYGQATTPYAQAAPTTQQNYGYGYNEAKYDNQAASQQLYGQQQAVSSQPGVYGQQASAPQPGYGQQQAYSKPSSYGAPSSQEMPPSYGPPRASQPGDPIMYQGPVPSSYGSSAPTQQSYPYGSNAPSQQQQQQQQQSAPAYNQQQTYGPTSGAMDGGGYTQSQSAGYPQHGGPAAPGYGGQPVVPAYAQSGGYGQYPSSSSQQGYGEPVNNVNYGYHGGSADAAGHGNVVPSSGYGASSGQPGYSQPPSNPTLAYYDQSVPQPGFGSHPGTAPVGFVKSASPQPGYGGGQYDSAQMHGHH